MAGTTRTPHGADAASKGSEFEKLTTKVLADNTAQSILNHLDKLTLGGRRYTSRWIWELMQNARDASAASQDPLNVTVEHANDHLVFEHNGGGFDPEEVIHLIYHGSTKTEDADTIGQYGSGFLATHLLSPKTMVSGCLTDGRGFRFLLERPRTSVEEMSSSMQRAATAFEQSLSSKKGDGITRFEYPLSPDVANTVSDGLAQLRVCAPYALIFNRELSTICIRTSEEEVTFEFAGRASVPPFDHVTRVTVTETTNGDTEERRYLVAKHTDATVALPITDTRCVPLGSIPRLFVGFPLVNTRDFCFPAIINSRSFKPTLGRDDVYLTDSESRATILEAGSLLVDICKCVASEQLRDAYRVVTFPSVGLTDEPQFQWLVNYLSSTLIQLIRKTPLVRTCAGNATSSAKAAMPFVENDEDDVSVAILWKLFHSVHSLRQTLVLEEESTGWAGALGSWLALGVDDLNEVYDGRTLVRIIEEQSGATDDDYGTVAKLNEALSDCEENTLLWLNQCHEFLRSSRHGVIGEKHGIVAGQDGTLRRLHELYRDVGIDDGLKDVAQLLDWDLELRDLRLEVLDDQAGAGRRDSDYVVSELLRRVRQLAASGDQVFKRTSPSFFGWLVGHRKWNVLDGYVAFSRGDGTSVIKLDSDPPLAPVAAWEADAREYCDLFPAGRILADEFYEVVSEADAWKELEQRGLVQLDLVIEIVDNNEVVHPTEALGDVDNAHPSIEPMRMTEVAYMKGGDTGIVRRVRKSGRLAYKLWRFLTEYLVTHKQGVFEQLATCECGEEHRYIVARWLQPIRNIMWVPTQKGGSGIANARSIAKLLRENGADGEGSWRTLSDPDSGTSKLLRAMDIAPVDIMKEWNPDAVVEVEVCLQEILAVVRGDVSRLREAKEMLVQRAERREMGRRNQELGKYVEKMVQESLEDNGFNVRPRHEGADLEITLGDVGRFDLIRKERRWLVEIKATREAVVRMSRAQADAAVQQGEGYLLCVVPIEEEGVPTGDAVWQRMTFVHNIGSLLAELVHGASRLDEERDKLVAEDKRGVRLEMDAGVKRFRISESVWARGFPLEELLPRLVDE